MALNCRGETASDRGSRGFATHEYALLAGNDAEAHGASVHGVRANVQGTLAPERKGEQLRSIVGSFGHLRHVNTDGVGLVVV